MEQALESKRRVVQDGWNLRQAESVKEIGKDEAWAPETARDARSGAVVIDRERGKRYFLHG